MLHTQNKTDDLNTELLFWNELLAHTYKKTSTHLQLYSNKEIKKLK